MLTIKTKDIWKGLAAYASDGVIDEGGLRATVLACLPVTSKQAFGFVDGVVDSREFPAAAAKYQGAIRNLILGLCAGSLGTEGFKFLTEHLGHVKMTVDEVPAPGSEGSEKYYAAGVLKPWPLGAYGALSMDGEDIVDPLCDFIMKECERARAEGSRLPLFICDLCKRIFVPDRMKATNRFCSPGCGTRLHNRENRNERTAEQFLRRLANYPAPAIVKKLSEAAYLQRYEECSLRAKLFPRSAKHIKAIEKAREKARATRATFLAES